MTESLHTLQEFMTHTKGMIYILSVGYLVGFAYFWKFLNRNERDRDV